MSTAAPKLRTRKRRGARFALCCLVGLLLVLGLAVMAPWLVNRGLGRGMITGALERHVNGTVAIKEIGLSWLAPQTVRGLVVSDPSAQTVVQLDLDVSAGLLGLLWGGGDLEIGLAGNLRGTLRQNGSTSFEDLLAAPPPAGESAKGPAEPLRLPLSRPATVRVKGLDVVMVEEATGRQVALEDVTATLAWRPGEHLTMDLGAAAVQGDRRGAIAADADIAGLFDAAGTLSLQDAAGRLDVKLRDVPVPLAARPTLLRSLVLAAGSDGLSKGLAVRLVAEAVIDGAETGRLEADLAIDRPVGPEGKITAGLDSVSGSIKGTSVPAAHLQQVLRATPIVAERDLGPTIDVDATISGSDGNVSLRASADKAKLEASGTVDQARRELRADKLQLMSSVSPELVAALSGVHVDRPAEVWIDAGPLVVPLAASALREAAVTADVSLMSPVGIALDTGAAPVAVLRGFTRIESPAIGRSGQLTASAQLGVEAAGPGEPLDIGGRASWSGTGVEGRFTASRPDTIAEGTFKLSPAGEGPQIEAELSNVDVEAVAALLGKRADALTEWLGRRGAVAISLRRDGDGASGNVRASFPALSGAFAVAREAGMITVTAAEDAKLTLPKDAIQRRLAPAAAADQPAPASVVVGDDVPLTIAVKAMRFPEALLSGESFDGSSVRVDLALSGGPLVLTDAEAGSSSLDRMKITLATSDLAQGVAFTAKGDVMKGDEKQPGRFGVEGTVAGLMKEGRLSTGGATLQMKADVRGIHSGLIDAAADLQGLFVAAVGPRVDVDAVAKDFSRTSGTLQALVTAQNARLDVEVTGREDGLVIQSARPLTAELAVTPPLGQRVLSRIHPLLADIRSTEQPLRATVTDAFVPLDGNVKRLNADLDMTVGPVEFDSGSVTLAVMRIFQGAPSPTIPGFIEPIKARIREGVVTYDRFAVRVDRYEFAYSGRIDLNTQVVQLKTEIPLEALAVGVRPEDLGAAAQIRIPVYLQGRLGNLGVKIDEQELAKAIAKATLGEELERQGIPKEVGDLLDNIFKPKKKEEKK